MYCILCMCVFCFVKICVIFYNLALCIINSLCLFVCTSDEKICSLLRVCDLTNNQLYKFTLIQY